MKYRLEKFSENRYIVYVNDKHVMNVWKESNYWRTSISADSNYKSRKQAVESNLDKM